MPCSAVTLSLATITGIIATGLLAIAFSTDNWLYTEVKRAQIQVRRFTCPSGLWFFFLLPFQNDSSSSGGTFFGRYGISRSATLCSMRDLPLLVTPLFNEQRVSLVIFVTPFFRSGRLMAGASVISRFRWISSRSSLARSQCVEEIPWLSWIEVWPPFYPCGERTDSFSVQSRYSWKEFKGHINFHSNLDAFKFLRTYEQKVNCFLPLLSN